MDIVYRDADHIRYQNGIEGTWRERDYGEEKSGTEGYAGPHQKRTQRW